MDSVKIQNNESDSVLEILLRYHIFTCVKSLLIMIVYKAIDYKEGFFMLHMDDEEMKVLLKKYSKRLISVR